MRCEQKTAGVMSETGSYKIDYMENQLLNFWRPVNCFNDQSEYINE